MGSAPDEQGGGPPSPRMRRSPAQEALDELRVTLDICRRALPWDTHPEHDDRLRRIEGMVRWSLEHGEQHTGHQVPGAGLRSAGGPRVG